MPTSPNVRMSPFLNTSLNNVSQSFFDTLAIAIVAGRGFEGSDAQRTSPSPVVINEAFAQMLFPDEHAVGETFGQGEPGETATAKFLVIGVAGGSKYRSLREVPPPIY